MNSSTGMATNAYGLYSITLHTGRCVLQCSMLGYTTWSDTLQLSDNTVVDIPLQPNDYLLKGVEILGPENIADNLCWCTEDTSPACCRRRARFNKDFAIFAGSAEWQ